jgi:glycosyltransferase A (GT-A) superfamily protein (DUF2064 family)
MDRVLVLFAREPGRQAREKGLGSPGAAELFREFARGWRDAARLVNARFVLAAPPEDRSAWETVFGASEVGWLSQRGSSIGSRLEDAATRAAAHGGQAVLVGGDVAPSAVALLEAFHAMEGGASAAISPAPDGGFSLVALTREDLDLLRGVRERRRTVLRDLLRALAARQRAVRLVSPAADVDGRGSLRAILSRNLLPARFVPLARQSLAASPGFTPQSQSAPAPPSHHGPSVLRGPPLPA